MSEVKALLNFMVEVEKLKSVLRKTKPVGLDRYENSAEHSWHVSLMALLLKDHSDNEIDIHQVVKMLLIHDLSEILVGDTIVYDEQSLSIKAKESDAIKTLFALLPVELAQELTDLWHEFEAGQSNEAKYAKAIDRIPPLLHNIHGEGHSWKKHNVPKEKVFNLNRERIQGASQSIWQAVEDELQLAVAKGNLI